MCVLPRRYSLRKKKLENSCVRDIKITSEKQEVSIKRCSIYNCGRETDFHSLRKKRAKHSSERNPNELLHFSIAFLHPRVCHREGKEYSKIHVMRYKAFNQSSDPHRQTVYPAGRFISQIKFQVISSRRTTSDRSYRFPRRN